MCFIVVVVVVVVVVYTMNTNDFKFVWETFKY